MEPPSAARVEMCEGQRPTTKSAVYCSACSLLTLRMYNKPKHLQNNACLAYKHVCIFLPELPSHATVPSLHVKAVILLPTLLEEMTRMPRSQKLGPKAWPHAVTEAALLAWPKCCCCKVFLDLMGETAVYDPGKVARALQAARLWRWFPALTESASF